MQTTLLSSKGQVIIPKTLRDAHRWHAGTRLEVLETAEGILLKPVVDANKTALPAGLAAIRKRIAHKGPAVSIEDMNAAVLRGAARRNTPSKAR
jgi:AbrB family looped-hinge helix DNA binding protein